MRCPITISSSVSRGVPQSWNRLCLIERVKRVKPEINASLTQNSLGLGKFTSSIKRST